jgi:hypothetical protein
MKARITRASGKQEFDEVKERNFFNYVCFLSNVNIMQRTANVRRGCMFDLIKKIELIDCSGVILETFDWSKSYESDFLYEDHSIKARYEPIKFIY